MGQILVRKIDDEALERLKRLAADRKTSVEALARQAIEREAEQKTASELRDWLDELDEVRKLFPKSNEDSTVLIRALRDGDDSDD
jgi:predicted transcriptional regulator